VQASNEPVITAGRSGLASAARLAIAAVVATGAVLWRASQGSSAHPPAAVISASPGAGWSATNPTSPGVQTYGGQWLFNLDRSPITLTRIRLIGVTAGFHVLTITIARERRSNELNVAGYPTSVAPHPHPVAGYVLVPLDHHAPAGSHRPVSCRLPTASRPACAPPASATSRSTTASGAHRTRCF
jgi:hypothetical protein